MPQPQRPPSRWPLQKLATPFFAIRLCWPSRDFFFFQAEDCIRGIGVTGVQTCALPILVQETFLVAFRSCASYDPRFAFRTWLWTILRSEERRVGKECRSRWSRDQE